MTKTTKKTPKKSSPVEVLKTQLAEKEKQYLRALADYQNLEKRISESNQHQEDLKIKSILLEFVSINDDLEKAVIFEKDPGLKLIKDKFSHILSSLGIKEIDVLHQPFSPETMECIQTKPGKKDNLVMAVHQKGYLYQDQLLRPARVVVSKLAVSDLSDIN